MNFQQYLGENMVWFLPLLIWALFWKGYGLWTASKNNQKGWFVALLIVNTFGILEIIYTFGIAKKKWSDVTALFKHKSTPTEPAQ